MPETSGRDDAVQLRELDHILTTAGLDWWVCCGTLLGLARSGEFIAWDVDVDLECWAQPEGWEVLDSLLTEAGYSISKWAFRGMVYKYWLKHPRWKRTVDLHVLRLHNDVAWYPVKISRPSRFAKRSLRWYLMGVLRGPLRKVWKKTALLDNAPVVWRFMRRLDLHMNTSMMPAFHYGAIERISFGDLEVPVPADYEAYLEYRYGDWRVPDSNWDFLYDDPAHAWAPPPVTPVTPPLA